MQAGTKQQTIAVKDLGLIQYREAYGIQQEEVKSVIAGGPQKMLMCEHPAVLTLGRIANDSYILKPQNEILAGGVEILRIDRGGEVTLHAPGQLVAYPILDLNNYGRNLRSYMSRLEKVMIEILGEFDILAERKRGETGVWAGRRKIGSIGVGVRKWVAYHGFSLNVDTNLDLYGMIKPCGLDTEMTSIKEQLGRGIDMKGVKEAVVRQFKKEFSL